MIRRASFSLVPRSRRTVSLCVDREVKNRSISFAMSSHRIKPVKKFTNTIFLLKKKTKIFGSKIRRKKLRSNCREISREFGKFSFLWKFVQNWFRADSHRDKRSKLFFRVPRENHLKREPNFDRSLKKRKANIRTASFFLRFSFRVTK